MTALAHGEPAPDRALGRLLRFLASGPARADRAGLTRIGAASLGRLRVEPADLARAVAGGLAARLDSGEIALTPAGRALLCPEAERPAPRAGRAARRLIGPDGTPAVLVVDDAESPLAWLRRRRGRDGAGLIGDDEFQAGERLRVDFTRAGLMPTVTSNWSAGLPRTGRGGGRGGVADLTDAALAARDRVRRALGAVGPELDGVLVDVCCFLKGLETVELERGWPGRSGKVVLRVALKRLAAHYGLGAVASGPERSRRLRHWGSPDYRPTAGAPP